MSDRFLPLVFLGLLFLCGCRSPEAAYRPLRVDQLAAFTEPTEPIDRIRVETRLLRRPGGLLGFLLPGREETLSAPAVTVLVGQETTIEIAREFIYPTAFRAPELRADGVVTPATPERFETKLLGLAIELTSRQAGAGMLISGQVRNVAFDGFLRGQAELYAPIRGAVEAGGREVTLTENVVNAPSFTTRETVFHLAAREGDWYPLPIELPEGRSVLELRWTQNE